MTQPATNPPLLFEQITKAYLDSYLQYNQTLDSQPVALALSQLLQQIVQKTLNTSRPLTDHQLTLSIVFAAGAWYAKQQPAPKPSPNLETMLELDDLEAQTQKEKTAAPK
ncbi:MAG: hypothetical protein LBH79_02550 [Nitrososphaerota archaeon]|jgi:hypothetical protein|nr:hypothetical protein [Nitrososphaerota archaeon]